MRAVTARARVSAVAHGTLTTHHASLRRVALLVWALLTAAGLAELLAVIVWGPGADFHAYWDVNLGNPYGQSLGQTNAFLYSPVVALAAAPLRIIPFEAARLAWLAVNVGCLVYLVRRWALAALVFLPVALELYWGNVDLVIAVGIVVGFRYPAAWAFALLTKVTPGVGLVWFLVRREWRSFALALGMAVALSVVSFLVVPAWWGAWLQVLSRSTSATQTATLLDVPIGFRMVAAMLLVAWGAVTDRRWIVPVAVTLAAPAVWRIVPAILVAVVPLWRGRRSDSVKIAPSAQA